jgi:metal-dependent HD superfamily phosphatase/phosphodiesterase
MKKWVYLFNQVKEVEKAVGGAWDDVKGLVTEAGTQAVANGVGHGVGHAHTGFKRPKSVIGTCRLRAIDLDRRIHPF